VAMRQRSRGRMLVIRVVQIAIAGALALSVAACHCPPPNQLDEIFLLDASLGTPLNTTDAGLDAMSLAPPDAASDAMSLAPPDAASDASDATVSDAAPFDAASADGPSSDGQSPATWTNRPPPIDCTGAAHGCIPGGDCPAACECVLRRDGRWNVATVQSCILLALAGPPQVEIRYEVPSFCGGD
jgi:hypothetical protein